jgi:ATP adenylyltransferase
VATAGKPGGCFLCERAAEANDDQNLILFRGERAFVIMNLFPYNTAHLLIAPYVHTGDFPGLDEVVASELTALSRRCVRILRDEYRPDGFNLGMNLGALAGAGLPDHLHVHVVPRWAGDTNFMAAVGETKVLPESLGQTFARLKPLFA